MTTFRRSTGKNRLGCDEDCPACETQWFEYLAMVVVLLVLAAVAIWFRA